ncbi:MAG TPA: PEP-utilizing enzyme, partial [Gemmataceae bacterium]|nr:PEP-utilizing enzyme [Gemmataceae bacterium]
AELVPETGRDLTQLDAPALLDRFQFWAKYTLDDFARDSLKPTALAGMALVDLEKALARVLQLAGMADPLAGLERAKAALRELVMGVHPEVETDLPAAVRDLAAGRLDRGTFLVRFGHRGSQEMELAQPRWSEDHTALDHMIQAAGTGPEGKVPAPVDALVRVAAEAGLQPAQRTALAEGVQTLHTYLGLRESAKHYLMQGYALLRRILVELDRRYDLGGGIFYLTPEDLPALVKGTSAGQEVRDLIARRKRRREVALSLYVPQVLFSDDLEAIDRETQAGSADMLQGVPLSAGVVEGPALVLNEPTQTQVPHEAYILVCPSTDPAWVPLFVHARGLVMETGGVLSHGAIVAREFGLPAVAGLPEVHRRLRTGQRLRVDGGTGRVNILA